MIMEIIDYNLLSPQYIIKIKNMGGNIMAFDQLVKKPENLFIAYFSNNKQLVAHSMDKQRLESYLFKTDLYDKVTIFESDNKKFNDAIYFEYWSYRLIMKDYLEQSFICTEREYTFLCKMMSESRQKIYDIIDNMRYIVNVLDLNEKEMNKLCKATRILSGLINTHYEDIRLVPKGCLDNKTLRKLMDMEDELLGNPDSFDTFYHKYDIILI
jgi:hypothetical protein